MGVWFPLRHFTEGLGGPWYSGRQRTDWGMAGWRGWLRRGRGWGWEGGPLVSGRALAGVGGTLVWAGVGIGAAALVVRGPRGRFALGGVRVTCGYTLTHTQCLITTCTDCLALLEVRSPRRPLRAEIKVFHLEAAEGESIRAPPPPNPVTFPAARGARDFS